MVQPGLLFFRAHRRRYLVENCSQILRRRTIMLKGPQRIHQASTGFSSERPPRSSVSLLMRVSLALVGSFILVAVIIAPMTGSAAMPDPLTCTVPGTLVTSDPAGDQTGAPAA